MDRSPRKVRLFLASSLLAVVTAGLCFLAGKSFRAHLRADLKAAEAQNRSVVEARRDAVQLIFNDRQHVLENLTQVDFSPDIVAVERLEANGWLWIRAPGYQWKSATLAADAVPPSLQDPKHPVRQTFFDPDRKILIFQIPVTKKNLSEEKTVLAEAAVSLTRVFGKMWEQDANVAVYFVGPDGTTIPLGEEKSHLDLRPGKHERRRLASDKASSSETWSHTVSDRFSFSGRATSWTTLAIPGSDFKVLFASSSEVAGSFLILILCGLLSAGLWTLFFYERMWLLLPAFLDARKVVDPKMPALFADQPAGAQTSLTESTEVPQFKEDMSSEDRTLGSFEQEDPVATTSAEVLDPTAAKSVKRPPTLVPRLFLRKKAEQRTKSEFTLLLSLEERQSFINRMGLEIGGFQDVDSLNKFFTGTLSRLFDQCPVAYFEYQERDGKTLLKGRWPENLFSQVIPSAFLPAGVSQFLETSIRMYLKDLSKLSPELVTPETEWTVFITGAGTNACGFWCLPLKLNSESRFFVRMLCEIHQGHCRFLIADEADRRKTFHQETLVKDRMLEEILVGKRLRHPFTMGLVETKLWDPQRSTLESMIFGREADETLRARGFFQERVRRSDHVYILNENQLLLFYPHTAVLDMLQKTEKMVQDWNAQEPTTHGVRAALVEFPTHGESLAGLWKVLLTMGEQLKKAPPGQVLLATAPAGYLPPFKSRFIRSAVIPENSQ